MLKKSTINNSDYFKWKEGLFCFENESIQDLIKKLELYYDTTIEIQRPHCWNITIPANFVFKME